MSLATLAARTPAPQHARSTECRVCAFLDMADEQVKADLLGALSNQHVQYAEISQALDEIGVVLHRDNLSRHARGLCQARTPLRKGRGAA